jgi:hypothetical protein
MRAPITFFFAIILLFTSSAYAQQNRGLGVENSTASANRRIALVIGNGAYTSAPLKNPPNDATDMAKALSNVGFTVEHGLDLTQRQMKVLIREFGQKLKAGGQGLFYFAGHGIQLKGRNYLIPVDAEITSEADVEDQGVDVNLVMGLMDEAGNGLNVVILDACRNNPFARSFRSTADGLAQVDAPTGTLVAYSTAPGRVARDGVGRNGPYTAELLKQMRVPGLPIEEVMKRVRASLKQLTNGEQIPWESSSLVGNFYLNKAVGTSTAANNPVSVGPGAPPANPAVVEQEYWETIKGSQDVEDFRDYLKEYPSGPHAVIARSNLRRLEASNRTSSDAAAGRAGSIVGAGGWVQFNSAEGRYNVLLPQQPALSSQMIPDATGGKVLQYLAQAADSDSLYAVSYIDLLPTSMYSLEMGRDGMVKAGNGILVSSKAISSGGYQGLEFRVKNTVGDGMADVRVYRVGNRVYAIAQAFSKSSDSSTMAEKRARFFESFRFVANN